MKTFLAAMALGTLGMATGNPAAAQNACTAIEAALKQSQWVSSSGNLYTFGGSQSGEGPYTVREPNGSQFRHYYSLTGLTLVDQNVPVAERCIVLLNYESGKWPSSKRLGIQLDKDDCSKS